MVENTKRSLGHGVVNRTNESLLKIEDWLVGKWSIGIEGLDDMRQKKTIKIVYREADDKRKFMVEYGGGMMAG